MPKTPKDSRKTEKEKPVSDHKDSWEEDQKNHEYYYDDAHGYEVYDPLEEEKDDSEG